MKKLCLILLLLLIVPCVYARQGEMKLLAVRESNKGGNAADLFLEIKPGSGRVFIETVPLTKFDTQISTRFAKDIACDFLDKNCDKYDFFYAINAEAPIIGGPSAGAAIAVLTASVLESKNFDEGVSMTGTINSGGVIGPVGGLRAKIEAASEANIKTVLIPKGGRFMKELNLTVDLVDYGKKLGVAVVEVGDLNEALYYFTGEKFKAKIKEVEIDDSYKDTMKFLAEDLCGRTSEFDIDDEFAFNLSKMGEELFESEMYYSAASRCFGANVRYKQLSVKDENASFYLKEIEDFEKRIDSLQIETITDLQAYMVVKERLRDAASSLEKLEDEENSSSLLGYAIERIYSAKSWANFFNGEGKKFDFNKESLRQGCIAKLSEAEERLNYARLYFPESLEGTQEELGFAYDDYKNGDFGLCLFKASKVKAEADVVLSIIGIDEESFDIVMENKLDAVKRVISEQQAKDIFPILGYSYYEYANELKNSTKYTAMVYAEYALEMSNLDMYFKKQNSFNFVVDGEKLGLFLGGFFMGALVILMIKKKKVKKKRLM